MRPLTCSASSFVLALVALTGVLPQAASAHHYVPIQPGAQMVEPVGCTMNFVFEDAQGRLYIGTAGHCTSVGQAVGLQGVGIIGTTVYSSPSPDFAVVAIRPELYGSVSPSLRHWGGPVGALDQTHSQPGTLIYQYGYGIVLGSTEPTRPRAGILLFLSDRVCRYTADLPVLFGDSGSPTVTADGLAVGVVTNLAGASLHAGTVVGCALQRASAALGTPLRLRTAPLADPVERERERVRHLTGI